MTTRDWIAVAVAAISVIVIYAVTDPVPQDPGYFNLADSRTLAGIPNALNVLTNVPYLLIGLLGLREVSRWPPNSPNRLHAVHYRTFFIGIALTAFGSGYFHWAPGNATLVWDRLPMTILFMGFFASVISELVSPTAARRLLPILLLVGMGSVFYWAFTEMQGRGDLRFYGLVQFLPIVLILAMIARYKRPPRYGETVGFLVYCYVVAKIFEHFDDRIFDALGVISGHSLKHLISGLGGIFLLLWLQQRNDPADDQNLSPNSRTP